MRRSIVSFLSLLAVSYATANEHAVDPPNLLRNATFEAVDGNVPLHWRTNTWGGQATFSVEEAKGRSESRCVAIESHEGADASWSQSVAVEPDTRYRLTVWIKTENLVANTGFGAQVNFHELGMEGKTVPLHGTNDWTRLETTFESGSHRSLLVNLLFGGFGRSTGKAWFDDVTLVRVDDPLPTWSDAERLAFFENDVRPILERRCFACHGAEDQVRGNLFLTHRTSMLQGGDRGPVLSLERPKQSLLLRAVRHEDVRMPPKSKLPPAEIDALTLWVRLGAPWTPGDEPDERALRRTRTKIVTDDDKRHWAFLPVERPAIPTPRDARFAAHPVDAFLARRREERGLEHADEAARAVLVRRVTYDLTGLPPTPAEVEAFVADPRDDAFERLVDRLLASPHYGEHWGRHWLDLVRYAETNSFERDGAKPHVWRYRDYVISSLNEDKPFDVFTHEQLAGDELEDVTPESLIATGYYRLGAWDDEPADPELAAYDDLDDVITTTGQVFLGMTLNCARCHDHKIDPVPQRDYYRFLAFFRNVRRYGVRSHDSVVEASVREIATTSERARYEEAKREQERRITAVERELEAIEALVKPDFVPVEHEEFAHERNRVALVRKREGTVLTKEDVARYERLTRQRARLRSNPPDGLSMALVVKEHGELAKDTFLLARGNPNARTELVEPGFPTVLSPPEPAIVPPAHGESTGRRLALARWITSPRNPLTARVLVNRLWQYHFGRGLVRTPNDFGFLGDRPTHPELLDWLAAELVARDWSLKSMHRLILTSRAYRMTSRPSVDALARDERNDLFTRFDMRRLTAEELRDSLLAVNRSLSHAMFGESIYTKIPAEVLAGQSRPGDGWGNSEPSERARRSLYIHVKRSLIPPILASFDAADTDFTCPVRFATTQPTQALGMLNSTFLAEQAEAFARDLRHRSDDPRMQVRIALERVFQRPAKEHEVQRGLALIESLQRDETMSAEQSLDAFCLVALNLDEFLYLD